VEKTESEHTENAKRITRKLAIRVFLEDAEVDAFIQFLEGNGVLLSWGSRLHSFFVEHEPVPTGRRPEVMQLMARQLLLQMTSVLSVDKKIQCSESQGKQVLAFTRAILVEFVREKAEHFSNIITTIQAELHGYFVTRSESDWKAICTCLDFEELIEFEQSHRKGTTGEAPIFTDQETKDSVNGIKRQGRLIWRGNPHQLEAVARELVKLDWILYAEQWVSFFSLEVEYSGQVVCRNVQRGKIGLLIIFIKDLGLVELKGGNSHWPRIKAQFVGSTIETGEKWTWSRITSDVKSKEQNLRLFFEESRGLLELLGVKPDDIERFFSKRAAKWFAKET
jgi:hypothetical protein